MENDERKRDLYGENDIPKSKILNIEYYMNELTKEMPFGPTLDWTHIVLSNALISSLL